MKRDKSFLAIIIIVALLVVPVTANAQDRTSYKVYSESFLFGCSTIVVDDIGNIYLTNGVNTIQVYNSDGIFLYSLIVEAYGGSYEIAMEDGFLKVAVARGSAVYTYDNEGNFISETEDKRAKMFQKFREENANSYTTPSGDVYFINDLFGYMTVLKETQDNTVKIFSMPMPHWISKYMFSMLLFFALGFGAFFFFLFGTKGQKKNQKIKFMVFYRFIKHRKRKHDFIEHNHTIREIIRHIVTKGFFLVAVTVTLSNVMTLGYENVGFEIIAGAAYIIPLYFIIDLNSIVMRYILGDFKTKEEENHG